MFVLVKGLEKRRFSVARIGIALMLSAISATALIDPWINEVDYDQPGSDTNEWIELAGPAGQSLDDFEILLINQTGSAYTTIDLAAAAHTFSNEINGVGFFVLGLVSPGFAVDPDFTPAGWTSNEIQNGPMDSIQLRRKSGAVNVHLLDYDGQNTNTVESQFTDLADNNDDVGTTIYLSGIGTGFADFTWGNQVNAGTPGASNLGQTLPAADVVLFGLENSPETPLDTETVIVRVDATPENCAGNLVLTTLYRINSSGSYQSLPMSNTSGDTYEATIPAQAGGVIVEYYVSASFTGGGTNSPAVLPVDAPGSPASYTVFQLPPSTAWINEINYNGAAFDFDPETNEYIEVIGPSGLDLGGWSIHLVDDTAAVYAMYPFGLSHILPEDNTNGFGYFVLGDAGVPNVDSVFTNALDGAPNTSMEKRGAIRIVDDLGVKINEISYGFPAPTNTFPDAVYAGEDSIFALEDESLGLTNTGYRASDFQWAVNTTLTPGADNQNQTLTEPPPLPPDDPNLEIISIVQTGNVVTIESIGVPESWILVPEYSTDPVGGEGTWLMIGSSNTTYDNGTNTTVFTSPAPASRSILYRVRASDAAIVPSPDIVEITQSGGTDFEIKSMGTEGWNVIIEYTTDPPLNEPSWSTVPGVSNSFLAGMNTSTFSNPAPGAPLMHFRVRQTAP